MSIDLGGPAFPCEQHETQDNTWNQTFQSGMTLRDYFAAQALTWANIGAYNNFKELAMDCYNIADAMLDAKRIVRISE